VWLSALAIGLFQLVGSFGAAHNQPDRRSMDALAVILVLAGPAALAQRDRRPLLAVAVAMGAADVYIGLGYPYGPIFLSVVVALFSAVQSGHRRATWWLALAGFGGFVVATLLDPRGHAVGEDAMHLTLVAGWLIVVLAVSEVVRVRRDQIAERRRAGEDERQRQISEQRLRLAQDLHDVLAHNISLINVQASVALHLLDEEPDRARPALTNIKEASRTALHELRTALDILRRGEEAPRAPAPRLSDLGALVAGVRASGQQVDLLVDGTPTELSSAVELAGYRIVQEALTNVSRHAHATKVSVKLHYADGLSIEVIDDGVGSSSPAGNGILGMTERAASVGGTVGAGPNPGGGYRVIAHLPKDQP